jgi:hypothetical protein
MRVFFVWLRGPDEPGPLADWIVRADDPFQAIDKVRATFKSPLPDDMGIDAREITEEVWEIPSLI